MKILGFLIAIATALFLAWNFAWSGFVVPKHPRDQAITAAGVVLSLWLLLKK